MVSYHLGSSRISHEDYMRHIAGKGTASYPGFSQDPLDGFRHLADDLIKFGTDFLSGSGAKLKMAIIESEKRNKLSGFQKLSNQ